MGTLNASNLNLTGVLNSTQTAFKAAMASGNKTIGTGGVRMWNDANAFNGHHFTVIEYNIGSAYNASTTTFTAPQAGMYLMWSWFSTNGSAPAQNYTSCEYYVNGSRRGTGWQKMDSGYQIWRSWEILNLAKNDAITFGGEWQNNNAEFQHGKSWLGGYFLG